MPLSAAGGALCGLAMALVLVNRAERNVAVLPEPTNILSRNSKSIRRAFAAAQLKWKVESIDGFCGQSLRSARLAPRSHSLRMSRME
jgi:hypothetical protein